MNEQKQGFSEVEKKSFSSSFSFLFCLNLLLFVFFVFWFLVFFPVLRSVWSQGLTLVKQEHYHLSHSARPLNLELSETGSFLLLR
jgi:hypothetical protein